MQGILSLPRRSFGARPGMGLETREQAAEMALRELERILASAERTDGNAASTWRRNALHAPVWAIRRSEAAQAAAEAIADALPELDRLAAETVTQ